MTLHLERIGLHTFHQTLVSSEHWDPCVHLILFDFVWSLQERIKLILMLIAVQRASTKQPISGLPIKNENLFKPMEVQQCVWGQSINQTTGRQVGSGWESVWWQGHWRRVNESSHTHTHTHKEQSALNINMPW